MGTVHTLKKVMHVVLDMALAMPPSRSARSSASTTPADRLSLSDLRLQILERGLNKWSSTEQIQDRIVIKLHGPAGLMSLRILCYTLRVGQLQEMELSMHCHYFILGAAS